MKTRKLLAVLLTFAMTLSLLPMSAFAAADQATWPATKSEWTAALDNDAYPLTGAYTNNPSSYYQLAITDPLKVGESVEAALTGVTVLTSGKTALTMGGASLTLTGSSISAQDNGAEDPALDIQAGTVTFADAVTSVNSDATAIKNAGTLSLSDAATINGTTGIANTGTLTISDSEVSVTGTTAIANSGAGTVAISDGTINGDVSNSGTSLEISGGSITGAINSTAGTVAISNGTINGDVSNSGTSLEISGGTVKGAITNATGTVTIGTAAQSQITTLTNTSGTMNIESAVTATGAVSNGGTLETSAALAADSVSNTGTMTVGKGLTAATIENKGTSLTVNADGEEIKGTTSITNTSGEMTLTKGTVKTETLTNKGTLSVAGATVVKNSTSLAIVNDTEGVMSITGGGVTAATIENKGTSLTVNADASTIDAATSITNTSGEMTLTKGTVKTDALENKGTLNINGATVQKSDASLAITNTSGAMTISDGSVTADSLTIDGGTVTISGGTVKATTITVNKGALQITGGEVIGTISVADDAEASLTISGNSTDNPKVNGAITKNTSGTVSITGGKFVASTTTNLGALIADAYAIETISDNSYTAQVNEIKTATPVILKKASNGGNVEYAKVSTAVAAAANGDTIIVRALTEDRTYAAETYDLGDKTIIDGVTLKIDQTVLAAARTNADATVTFANGTNGGASLVVTESGKADVNFLGKANSTSKIEWDGSTTTGAIDITFNATNDTWQIGRSDAVAKVKIAGALSTDALGNAAKVNFGKSDGSMTTTVDVAAAFTVAQGSTVTLFKATVDTDESGSIVNNGTINLTDNGLLTIDQTGSSNESTGTINVNGSGAKLTLGAAYTNDGTIKATEGASATVALSAAVTNNGHILFANTTVLAKTDSGVINNKGKIAFTKDSAHAAITGNDVIDLDGANTGSVYVNSSNTTVTGAKGDWLTDACSALTGTETTANETVAGETLATGSYTEYSAPIATVATVKQSATDKVTIKLSGGEAAADAKYQLSTDDSLNIESIDEWDDVTTKTGMTVEVTDAALQTALETTNIYLYVANSVDKYEKFTLSRETATITETTTDPVATATTYLLTQPVSATPTGTIQTSANTDFEYRAVNAAAGVAYTAIDTTAESASGLAPGKYDLRVTANGEYKFASKPVQFIIKAYASAVDVTLADPASFSYIDGATVPTLTVSSAKIGSSVATAELAAAMGLKDIDNGNTAVQQLEKLNGSMSIAYGLNDATGGAKDDHKNDNIASGKFAASSYYTLKLTGVESDYFTFGTANDELSMTVATADGETISFTDAAAKNVDSTGSAPALVAELDTQPGGAEKVTLTGITISVPTASTLNDSNKAVPAQVVDTYTRTNRDSNGVWQGDMTVTLSSESGDSNELKTKTVAWKSDTSPAGTFGTTPSNFKTGSYYQLTLTLEPAAGSTFVVDDLTVAGLSQLVDLSGVAYTLDETASSVAEGQIKLVLRIDEFVESEYTVAPISGTGTPTITIPGGFAGAESETANALGTYIKVTSTGTGEMNLANTCELAAGTESKGTFASYNTGTDKLTWTLPATGSAGDVLGTVAVKFGSDTIGTANVVLGGDVLPAITTVTLGQVGVPVNGSALAAVDANTLYKSGTITPGDALTGTPTVEASWVYYVTADGTHAELSDWLAATTNVDTTTNTYGLKLKITLPAASANGSFTTATQVAINGAAKTLENVKVTNTAESTILEGVYTFAATAGHTVTVELKDSKNVALADAGGNNHELYDAITLTLVQVDNQGNPTGVTYDMTGSGSATKATATGVVPNGTYKVRAVITGDAYTALYETFDTTTNNYLKDNSGSDTITVNGANPANFAAKLVAEEHTITLTEVPFTADNRVELDGWTYHESGNTWTKTVTCDDTQAALPTVTNGSMYFKGWELTGGNGSGASASLTPHTKITANEAVSELAIGDQKTATYVAYFADNSKSVDSVTAEANSLAVELSYDSATKAYTGTVGSGVSAATLTVEWTGAKIDYKVEGGNYNEHEANDDNQPLSVPMTAFDAAGKIYIKVTGADTDTVEYTVTLTKSSNHTIQYMVQVGTDEAAFATAEVTGTGKDSYTSTDVGSGEATRTLIIAAKDGYTLSAAVDSAAETAGVTIENESGDEWTLTIPQGCDKDVVVTLTYKGQAAEIDAAKTVLGTETAIKQVSGTKQVGGTNTKKVFTVEMLDESGALTVQATAADATVYALKKASGEAMTDAEFQSSDKGKLEVTLDNSTADGDIVWVKIVSGDEETTTYYAITIDKKAAYTVNYDNGGGTGTADEQKVASGTSITLAFADDLGFSKEGYVFAKWSVVIGEAEAVLKDEGEQVTITANTTITATWTSSDKSLTGFSAAITAAEGESAADTEDGGADTFTLSIPYGTTAVTLTPTGLGDGAALSVKDGTDATYDEGTVTLTVLPSEVSSPKSYTFTVTAANGEAKEYTLNVTRAQNAVVSIDELTVTTTEQSTGLAIEQTASSEDGAAYTVELKSTANKADATITLKFDQAVYSVTYKYNGTVNGGTVELANDKMSATLTGQNLNTRYNYTFTVTAADESATEEFTLAVGASAVGSDEAAIAGALYGETAIAIEDDESGETGTLTLEKVDVTTGSIQVTLEDPAANIYSVAQSGATPSAGDKAAGGVYTITGIDFTKALTIVVKAEDGETTMTYTMAPPAPVVNTNGETLNAIKAYTATLADHPSGSEAKTGLTTDYTVTAGEPSSGEYDAKLTIAATNLKSHTNANGTTAYWVGVGVPAGATKYEWTFGNTMSVNDAWFADMNRQVANDGVLYNNIYFGVTEADGWADHASSAITVTYGEDEDAVEVKYEVEFAVTQLSNAATITSVTSDSFKSAVSLGETMTGKAMLNSAALGDIAVTPAEGAKVYYEYTDNEPAKCATLASGNSITGLTFDAGKTLYLQAVAADDTLGEIYTVSISAIELQNPTYAGIRSIDGEENTSAGETAQIVVETEGSTLKITSAQAVLVLNGDTLEDATSVKVTATGEENQYSCTVSGKVWLVLLGDALLDGEVDATDASRTARYVAGETELLESDLNQKAADILIEGELDATSASRIARCAAGTWTPDWDLAPVEPE